MRFEDLNGQELVAAWNAMVGEAGATKFIRPVSRFESREVGLRRCNELRKIIDEAKNDGSIPMFLRRVEDRKPTRVVEVMDQPKTVPTLEQRIWQKADAQWRSWIPTREHPTRPRKSTFAKIVRKELRALDDKSGNINMENASRYRRADCVIRTTGPNPYHVGSVLHKMFMLMDESPTVGEYLAKAEDQNKAKRYLAIALRDGHVKLLG